MFNPEKVNEITLQDLFLIADILNNIDFTIEYKQGKSIQNYGFEFIKNCLKASKSLQKDVYQLIANIANLTVEESKKLTFKQLVTLMDRIVEINDIQEVFTQAKELM